MNRISDKYTETFDISLDGDNTGEKWHGTFKVKTKLSHRDELEKDRFHRSLLGKEPGNPSGLASDLAVIFSELHVRVIESPLWWRDSGNGLDLMDANLAVEVYTKTMQAVAAAQKAVTDKAKEAVSELKSEKAE